jgi:hypothetical protein
MTKAAKKSYEVARLFAEGAESRGVKRAAFGSTMVVLSERQAEWLRGVAEREGGHYRGNGITSDSYRGGPDEPKPGGGEIAFTLWRRGQGHSWVMEYQDADPAIVAEKEAAYKAALKAWHGDEEDLG